MITDTQWLLRAVVAELEQAGISQCVTAPNVLTYEAALADLNQYPDLSLIHISEPTRH